MMRGGTDRWVYFIRPCGLRGPVKIGFSRNPRARLDQIQKHSPLDLELAAQIEVRSRVEGRFHALFVSTYLRDEWFGPSADIDRVITAINAGVFEVDALPKSVALYLVARERLLAKAA
jgi:hypothetical protein